MVNNSLNNAVKNDVAYRAGLPIGYQHLGGLCEAEKPSPGTVQRKIFENHINQLIKNLKNHMDFDHDIDTFSLKNYYTNSLPPSISDGELHISKVIMVISTTILHDELKYSKNVIIVELLRTVANGMKMQPNGKTTENIDLENEEVKFIRKNCFR